MAYTSTETFTLSTKTQADGDQTIPTTFTERYLTSYQGHFELSASPTAGTATIYGVPKGGTITKKISIGSVDLTGTDLLVEWTGTFDSIIVSPASLDADKTYTFILTAF